MVRRGLFRGFMVIALGRWVVVILLSVLCIGVDGGLNNTADRFLDARLLEPPFMSVVTSLETLDGDFGADSEA